MEFVPGTTLRSLMDKHKLLPLGPALQIFKQLSSGLSAVHKADIIHRDIKPENVMVLPNGMVKLMDFGVALGRRDGGGDDDQGLVVGSPYYMSPEQLQSGEIDGRSDIYSLGVLMFEGFTGQHPFPSDRLGDVIRKHVMAQPPRPCEIRPDLPEPLDKLILACLAKDPAERPESAVAVYAALLNASSLATGVHAA
jgi:serine/threonine-protein kinase